MPTDRDPVNWEVGTEALVSNLRPDFSSRRTQSTCEPTTSLTSSSARSKPTMFSGKGVQG